jgi:membrane protease YdiL (CAAX protease family)
MASRYFVPVLAILLFSPMFVLRQTGPLDFWWWMTANLTLLITLGFIIDKNYLPWLKIDFSVNVLKKIGLGLLSAAFLYGLFFAGNYLSRLWFGFAESGIDNVYTFKGNAPALRIALLMVLVIGPGEEIFWRGFLQRHYASKWGKWPGFIIALVLYTGVHVFTGNFMLVMAALICGIFWGWLYLKYESMLLNVVSHTIWDIVVFLVLPFGG